MNVFGGGDYIAGSRTVDLHVQRVRKKVGWEDFFDHCAQDGIPSGGTKMKFRWKLMIITMLIVSFSFGFGGMLLIQYSYQASIKQEKKSSKEFLRNDLKNVKRN